MTDTDQYLQRIVELEDELATERARIALVTPQIDEDSLEIGEGCRDIGNCLNSGYPVEDWCLPCRAQYAALGGEAPDA